jgi:hypothetical protein
MYQPSLLVVCVTLTHWCQQSTVNPDCRSPQLMVCHRPTRHEIQCTYHPLICIGAETPGGFGVGPEPRLWQASPKSLAAVD